MLKNQFLIPLLIISFYLVSHLVNLTILPVFADESIYIRWAQLILDEPLRYLFFPLNDGKTPLFIWILTPFQLLFADQLLAGRVVSVLVGAIQVAATGYLVHLLGGKAKGVWLSMILTTILPFWFFHHRMALIDGLLTVWLTTIMIGLIKLSTSVKAAKQPLDRSAIIWTAVIGACFGAAMLTKMPALLFLPTVGLFSFWLPLPWTKLIRLWLYSAAAVGIGMGLFLLLKLNPAFGQLFSRGGDFLYPWKEVIFDGVWTTTIKNWPTYISYFLNYLTIPVMLLSVVGLFVRPHQRTNHILFWSAMGFVLPIALLGLVVYPRYLLPAAIYFTVIAVLTFQDLVTKWVSHQHHLIKKMLAGTILVMLLANIVAASGVFMAYGIWQPNGLPFVSADRIQYLTEWSSGHGLPETVALIQDASQYQSLAVATEGFFGTLPDGMLMYFHRRNVDNLYVEGIGQPVHAIPTSFLDRAKDYDQIWLVVNSHRLKLTLPPDKLIAEYCRPYQAPCLQVWDITGWPPSR